MKIISHFRVLSEHLKNECQGPLLGMGSEWWISLENKLILEFTPDCF